MPLNIDWKQILLHLFNFVLLFAILFFLLYRPVKKFMDKRVQYYKDMDDDANKKLADAEELKQTYEEKLSVVDEEIAQKKQDADRLAVKERQEAMDRAEKEAAEIVSRAKVEGEAEKKKIVDGAQAEIVGLVAKAYKKAASDPSAAMDVFLSEANEGKDE